MSERAIQKLKRKFVAVAALSFTLVMVFIAGLIYCGNLLIVNNEINDVLTYIIDNNGELPSVSNTSSSVDKGDSDSPSEQVTIEDIKEQADKDKDGKKTLSLGDEIIKFFGMEGTYSSPEFAYSTRYFSVIYPKGSKDPTEVRTSHIASVDTEEAIHIADTVQKRTMRFGRYGAYYYKIGSGDNGNKVVVVMDCTSQISLSNRILKLAMIFILLGMIASLLILRAFSSKLVEPEIKNMENQKRFITNASHELKTPLAVIRANTEITEAMSGETEWTRATLRQVDRLQGLIQNLVLITRAQEQDSKSDRIDMDVSKAVRETIDNFAPVAKQNGLELVTDIPENLRMTAEGGQIRQLTTLFIDNAIKYCDKDGTITVRLSQARRGKQTILEFSNDYAAGKDVDYTRFFDRFYREDKSHNTDKGGYGIGLSIAESIVEQYHGTAEVSWKDGVITFTCRLNS